MPRATIGTVQDSLFCRLCKSGAEVSRPRNEVRCQSCRIVKHGVAETLQAALDYLNLCNARKVQEVYGESIPKRLQDRIDEGAELPAPDFILHVDPVSLPEQ